MTLLDGLVFLLLLCGSAFFSGSETALTSVSDVGLASLSDKGDRRAKMALSLIASRGTVIGALLIGNNIFNTLLAVYAATVFDSMILNSPLPAWMAPVAASVLSITVLLIGGEVLPKNIAIRFNERISMWVAYPCHYLVKMLTPILAVLNLVNRLVLLVIGTPKDRTGPSADELLAMVRMSQKAGIIDPMERELIGRSMFLNETMAREIMIHRTQMCAIAETASMNEVKDIYTKELYTRLPVYRESLDQIVGILNIKEVFRFDHLRETFRIPDVMSQPIFFPETARIGVIFDKMRQSRTHLAVVVDEFGTTSGIITLEDIVEQIFGEISDEYDQGAARIRWVSPRVFEAEGRTPISEIQAELARKKLPRLTEEACEDVETLAGIALRQTGRIPASGEAFVFEGFRFQVRKATGQKIQVMSVRVPDPEPERDRERTARQHPTGPEAAPMDNA